MHKAAHVAFAKLPPCLPECCCSVVVPVCNEEDHLWRSLSALRAQQFAEGTRFPPRQYEVMLLLNGCGDGSARIAARFRDAHPDLTLHVAEWTFARELAHAGSARSLLLCEAARRLAQQRRATGPKLLLTTDADTEVDPTWLFENVRSVQQGADAVGGDIVLRTAERHKLPKRVRRAYVLDRRYRRTLAALEALLDPLRHDPWPRHQHHFGGSLACTLEAYERVGGMRPVPALEDLAFYEDLLRSGARFRHEPKVRVYTSARTEGRAEVGLSQQFRRWDQEHRLSARRTELVTATLEARAGLRRTMSGAVPLTRNLDRCAEQLGYSTEHILRTMAASSSAEACWQTLQGDARVQSRLPHLATGGNMAFELGKLQRAIAQLRGSCAKGPCDTLRAGAPQAAATMAG